MERKSIPSQRTRTVQAIYDRLSHFYDLLAGPGEQAIRSKGLAVHFFGELFDVHNGTKCQSGMKRVYIE